MTNAKIDLVMFSKDIETQQGFHRQREIQIRPTIVQGRKSENRERLEGNCLRRVPNTIYSSVRPTCSQNSSAHVPVPGGISGAERSFQMPNHDLGHWRN
jgi:hypothetical protein